MLNFDFDYDLINILLLLSMYLVGRKVAKDSFYWKHTIWGIILFVLVEGARYGRGVDYIHYLVIVKK